MAKKIKMSKDEQQLYSELQKLVKKANQRLLRIERLTGEKGLFASKQLYDYLTAKELDAVSESGRIKLSKSYNIGKMQKIKKAAEQFLDKEESFHRLCSSCLLKGRRFLFQDSLKKAPSPFLS